MFVCVEWISLAQDEDMLGCFERGNEPWVL
jgi:hypothetical protein